MDDERRRGLILDPDGLDKWLKVEQEWLLLAVSSHSDVLG